MSANVESESSSAVDSFKWFLIIVILGGSIVANNLYAEMSVLIRASAFIAAVIVSLFLASTTEKGQTFLAFSKESRTEVRKVVWPSRQEAIHTTLIIGAATVVMALILWGLDAILMWAVGLVTGLRF